MTSATVKLPAPRDLQAALRKTTEALAHQLAEPGTTVPDWTAFEWLIARAVAAMHGVSPLLADTLKWRGPAGWAIFLNEQRAHTGARHPRIVELLRVIDLRARECGIAAIALKGAELHAIGLYEAGQRPMADVDLLVSPADVSAMTRMLESMGFHVSFSIRRHRVFVSGDEHRPAALGEHADNHMKVEVHERISETLPVNTAEVTKWIFPARAQAGLNHYSSNASLMGHLLLHAAGAMANRALRLLHLHDLALLSKRMSDKEWNQFLGQSTSDGGHWWAYPPLHMTARYYPGAIPSRCLIAVAADCPQLLRFRATRWRLSDVSLSQLSIKAFPGIEWSQSASEMMRYIAARVRPDLALLEQREHEMKTQVVAAVSRWHHLSQRQRLVRWLTSRKGRIRPDTIHAIRMAIAQSR
jgi:hypothetical protein